MGRKGWTLGMIGLLAVGLALLSYPTVSHAYNARRQSRVVAEYEAATNQRQGEYSRLWLQAQDYNQNLARTGSNFTLSDREKEGYAALLGEENTAIGFLEIPALSLKLPIYLGATETVLQAGVGVLEGSSIPIGGESTHAVLNGHRGLPTATLFTHLDRLQPGDGFTLHVLGQTAEYRVEALAVVEPEDMSQLTIREGEDWCTLVTCTPYGINSHRLLVQGRRVTEETPTTMGRLTADGAQVSPKQVTVVIWLGLLALVFAAWSGKVILFRRGEAAAGALQHRKGGAENEETG